MPEATQLRRSPVRRRPRPGRPLELVCWPRCRLHRRGICLHVGPRPHKGLVPATPTAPPATRSPSPTLSGRKRLCLREAQAPVAPRAVSGPCGSQRPPVLALGQQATRLRVEPRASGHISSGWAEPPPGHAIQSPRSLTHSLLRSLTPAVGMGRAACTGSGNGGGGTGTVVAQAAPLCPGAPKGLTWPL